MDEKKNQSIYSEYLEKVAQGNKFWINFQERSLKIDGKFVIKEGKYNGRLSDYEDDYSYLSNLLPLIETRYTCYKHSVPSTRSEKKYRTYFKALPELKLTQEDMMYGEPREIAQFSLEYTVLMGILLGAFKEWDDEKYGKWFWQSQQDKDLVILKDWVK